MKITLTIDTDSAAFNQDFHGNGNLAWNREISGILIQVREILTSESAFSLPAQLTDSTGNPVGWLNMKS